MAMNCHQCVLDDMKKSGATGPWDSMCATWRRVSGGTIFQICGLAKIDKHVYFMLIYVKQQDIKFAGRLVI
jgi:hypothetical protein